MLDLTYHEMCGEDREPLTALASNWTVVRQLGRWAWPADHDQIAKFCKPFEGDGFCYTIKDGGEWAGRIGITGNALGYTLPPSVHGRGIATAASEMAIDKGFDDLALDVIIASTWHDNPASARVLKKCGFTHWQTHYQDSVARGVPTLVQQYRLTRIDWQRLRA